LLERGEVAGVGDHDGELFELIELAWHRTETAASVRTTQVCALSL
jgi:hypothetical protein